MAHLDRNGDGDRRGRGGRRAWLGRLGIVALFVALALAQWGGTLPAKAANTTWYVDAVNGSELNFDICKDAQHPCPDLGEVVNFAAWGDTIVLAPGTYRYNGPVDKSLTIIGAGQAQTTITAVDPATGSQADDAVFNNLNSLGNNQYLNLSDLTITGAAYEGGLINYGVMTLSNVTVSGNAATIVPNGDVTSDRGGGITNYGTLTGNHVQITNNSAPNGTAGGIANNGGTLTLTDSSVSGNTADEGGGIATGLNGSATLIRSVVDHNSTGALDISSGALNVYNSTVADNRADNREGAGLYVTGGTVNLVNATVSGNQSTNYGGGGIYIWGTDINQPNSASITLTNTIVAGNSAANSPDCLAALTDGGHNILGNNQGCSGLTNGQNGSQVGTPASPLDPKLHPLGDNGGPTQTMAIAEDSSAFGQGDGTVCQTNPNIAGIDQRSDTRNVQARGGCDIGAYDTGSLIPPAPVNVQAVPSTSGGVLLVWSPPPGYTPAITTYLIECQPDCPTATGLTVSGNPANPSTTVGGLTVGTSYTFTVTAENSDGLSVFSAPSNAVTVEGLPDPPTNVTASLASSTSATVSWSAPQANGGGIIQYTVECSPACPSAGGLLVGGNPPATNTTVTGLTPGDTYTFTVLATSDATGTSFASDPSNPVTLVAPIAPTLQVDPASDSGAPKDGITNDATPTFVGKTDAGATVTVWDGSTELGTTTAGDDGLWSYTPASPLGDGSHLVTAWASNAAGKSESPALKVVIDTAPPALSLTNPADGGFSNAASPTFSGTAGRASGDAPTVEIKLYPGSDTQGTPLEDLTAPVTSGSFTVTASSPLAEGSYTVVASQSDLAGNVGSSRATFTLDLTPPVTTATAVVGGAGSSTAYASGTWTNQTVTVTLQASDGQGGSGIGAIYYSIDGGPTQSYTAGSPISFSSQGISHLTYWSVDKAGNVEDKTAATNTIEIDIDTTAPNPPIVNAQACLSGGSDCAAYSSGSWTNRQVIVSFSANGDAGDLQSGGVTCSPPLVVSDEVAGKQVSGTCIDLAGNVSTPSTPVTVNIDLTAPTLDPSVSPNPIVLHGSATASAGAGDALSSIASRSCTALDTSSVGTKTVTCSATDKAGNTAQASATYQVGYAIKLIAAPTMRHGRRVGSPAIMFQLVDAKGVNESSANLAVTELCIVPHQSAAATSCGSAQPLNQRLRYVRMPAGGTYVYIIQPGKLARNREYDLLFSAAGDPVIHSVTFAN